MSTTEVIRGLVEELYDIGGRNIGGKADGFLGMLRVRRVSREKLGAGASVVEYILNHGPTSTEELLRRTGYFVSQLPSLSPTSLGIIRVVNERHGKHYTYDLAVHRESAERYVSLVRKLISAVDHNES